MPFVVLSESGLERHASFKVEQSRTKPKNALICRAQKIAWVIEQEHEYNTDH